MNSAQSVAHGMERSRWEACANLETMGPLAGLLMRGDKESAAAQIRELEQEIDARVYRLYGLTAEEIEIVEGSAS